MEEQGAIHLDAVPRTRHRVRERLQFLFGVLILFTAMQGGSLILDAVYYGRPMRVPGIPDLETDRSWRAVCSSRLCMAYAFVGVCAWQVARQYWPDVQPDGLAQPASTRSLTPQQRRRFYTTAILLVYFILADGFWLAPQTIISWIFFFFGGLGVGVDFWQAALTTLMTCTTYLVVYYTAWMVTGMWCQSAWWQDGAGNQ